MGSIITAVSSDSRKIDITLPGTAYSVDIDFDDVPSLAIDVIAVNSEWYVNVATIKRWMYGIADSEQVDIALENEDTIIVTNTAGYKAVYMDMLILSYSIESHQALKETEICDIIIDVEQKITNIASYQS